jgi:hypothetical protein
MFVDKAESGLLNISGQYYKHVTIVNYASSGVNKLRASFNDDARVVIYNLHMFIVQATGVIFTTLAEIIDACLMLVLSQVEMTYETCPKMRCEVYLMSQGVSYLTNIPLV